MKNEQNLLTFIKEENLFSVMPSTFTRSSNCKTAQKEREMLICAEHGLLFFSHLCEMTVDLPPAKDQLRLLVTDLLQTLQVFERACVEDLQDFLSGLLQDRCVQLRLPFCLHYVLLAIRSLRQK